MWFPPMYIADAGPAFEKYNSNLGIYVCFELSPRILFAYILNTI